MIEISHAQARRLLREKIDGRPISDEQWAILQAHLEACPACRADQERLAALERAVAHTLRLRWSGRHETVKKPVQAAIEAIFAVRRARARRRKQVRYALQALLVLALLAGYTRYRQATAPPPPTPTPTLALVTGTGTPPPAYLFRGVVAVETAQAGRPQVALLNPLPGEPAGVSRLEGAGSPGSSTRPAWSPDGQWVAFLADRTGKNEVYVIHVSGTRLTRLTDNPLVTWRGPLTWSADGQWIALVGASGGATAHANVYLVPVNGSGARTLGFTRDTPGPVAFSPATALLAFGAADYGGSLLIYNLASGQFLGPTYQDTFTSELRFSPSGGLAWSPDGDWLAYVVEGREPTKEGQASPGAWISQLRLSYNYIQSARNGSNNNTNRIVLTYAGEHGIQGLAWSPDTQRRLLAFLRQDPADPCLTVHLVQAQGSGENPLKLGGLCVEGGLSPASWTADGQWLVVLGHRPGEGALAYYALRVPGSLNGPGVAQYERLADATGERAGDISLPQVRPTGKLLNLQPKAVSQAGDGAIEGTPLAAPAASPASTPQAAAQEPAAPARPSFLMGKVAYLPLGQRSANSLTTMLPDGQIFQELQEDGFEYSCPAFSPDGMKIAFLRAPAGQRTRTDVFVKGTIGTDVVRLSPEAGMGSGPGGRGASLGRYSCPAWSPDGARLAALEVTPGGSYRLVILDPEAEDVRATAYLPYPSFYTRLVWSPDGKAIFVAHPAGEQQPARITRCEPGKAGDTCTDFIRSTGWHDVFGMALSPDGGRFAFLSALYAREQIHFQLHIYSTQTGGEVRVLDLPTVETESWFGSKELTWLADGSLGFVYRHRADARIKTELYRVNPWQGAPAPLAQLDEVVYDLAWSPDGAWVIYTAESGVYALQMAPDLPGLPQPVLLVEQRASEVDWR